MYSETDNNSSITDALNQTTIPIPSAWVYEDLLLREINQHLLNLGHDTISREDLVHEMEARGYRRFLDAIERAHWKGIGVLSDRTEETVVGVEEIYPIVVDSARRSSYRDIWIKIKEDTEFWIDINRDRILGMDENDHQPTEVPPWESEEYDDD